MINNQISMEDYFTPGFKISPSVHVGSQTVPFFRGIPEEQAYEGYYLAAAGKNDLVVVRNIDEGYIQYWKKLIGNHHIINLKNVNPGEFLTQVILDDPKIIEEIKRYMDPRSRLYVFSPTHLELQLAEKLGIPLHGKPDFSDLYGTKSGIRLLAEEYKITMAPGFICKSVNDVEKALLALKDNFTDVVIKYDYSLGGYFNKKVHISERETMKKLVDEIANGIFHEGEGVVVVEGWIKSKAAPCAHIEILENKDPIIAAAWQQIVDVDSVSRIGACPLNLSNRAMKSFLSAVKKIAFALKEKGAIGSYGPDFLITDDSETQFHPDTAVLIELNARIPMTAIALEIVRQVRGKIGTGFLALNVKLESHSSFGKIEEKLASEGILIRQKNPKAEGVVPFNVGLLPWNIVDLVAMADTWNKTQAIMNKAQSVLQECNLT
jgi:hypothetical protein